MHGLEEIRARNTEVAEKMRMERGRPFRIGRVVIPGHVKNEIVDDILEIVAFTGSAKKARRKLRALIDLWID